MMSNDILNTLVLGILLALTAGFGLYVTQKTQPAELERLEQEEKALRLRHAAVTDLLASQAESQAQAEHAIRRWNSRYKMLPQYLSSPAVVAYLNQLSRQGFRSFDISFGGVARRNGYSILTYNIRGTSFFESLYDFIWEVENGRGLYRISDVTLREVSEEEPNPVTGVGRLHQLVTFSMKVEAYFGGAEGMSAPDSIITVPDHVLPPRNPGANPFYPLILSQLPPNTDNLVDIDSDELISIVGDAAVFRTSMGPRSVRQGERVYLGRISTVDPKRARIVADLNRGGIREQMEIELATGERFRQAMGRVQIVPLTTARPDRPVAPQPGTPEYRRLFGDGPMSVTDELQGAPSTGAPAAAEYAPAEAARDEQPQRGVSVRPFPGATRTDQ
jgi:Tfp pilus assembly protein PilO